MAEKYEVIFHMTLYCTKAAIKPSNYGWIKYLKNKCLMILKNKNFIPKLNITCMGQC